MARRSRNQVEGRSNVTRVRKLHELEDSETEEELRRFLREGSEMETAETDRTEEKETDAAHRPYHMEPQEAFGSLGQFWLADS